MSESGGHKRPLIINLLKKKDEKLSFAHESESGAQAEALSLCEPEAVPMTSHGVEESSFNCAEGGLLYEDVCSGSDWEQSDSENESPRYERTFQTHWRNTFPFIEYDAARKVMFCKVCKTFATGLSRNMPLVAGSNNFKITSIRFHEKSALHNKCQKLFENDSADLDSNILDLENERILQVLKSVYLAVQTKTPYNSFPVVCEALRKEGINIGSAYTSHYKIVPHFAKYIAESLEKELSKTLPIVPFFALILDSSVRRSVERHELVYIKYFDELEMKCRFISVIDSKDKTGDSIYSSLTAIFERLGIANWAKKIVYLTCDKSHNFCLWHESLLNRLHLHCVDNFVCDVHCLPHKLKHCSCVFENNALANSFSTQIWLIYWFCASVPNDKRKLPHISEELDLIVAKFNNFPRDSFITFYLDALLAVFKDWDVLVPIIKTKQRRPRKIQTLVGKIRPYIATHSFIYELAIFIDIFLYLDCFSKKLKLEDTLPYEAHEEFQRVSCLIPVSADGEGPVAESVKKELENDHSTFRGIEMEVDIELGQVIEELGELKEALTSHFALLMKDECVLQCTDILNTSRWPRDEELTEYGNKNFASLFFMLGGKEEDFPTAFSEWLSLKDRVVITFPEPLLLTPKAAVLKMVEEFKDTLPVVTVMLKKLLLLSFSSPEVEKGYIEMNMIKTSGRMNMSLPSLQSSMFIVMNGPPVSKFNPLPAFELWYSDCKRRYRRRTAQPELE
ncbi:zinc finger protein 862-like [Uloborus diversus]|uniref:zinc finger protein 862-like n=1 Tax=Uloborus diversus TaxID=327109 RepID=UPI00240A8906|nr:zinc finger protein 862-like [Uloborus diversus]XP_054710620.1 zinc finger protein 862-like [Uloborus diversus]